MCAALGWLSRDWSQLALWVIRGQWLREAAEPWASSSWWGGGVVTEDRDVPLTLGSLVPL